MALLFAWGANNCGQLGIHSLEDQLLPFQTQEVEDLCHPGRWAVGGGGAFSFIIEESGALKTCGNNDRGQQGKEDKANVLVFSPVPSLPLTSKCVKVTAGWDFILAIKDDGMVLSWGSNTFGQLGRHLPDGKKLDHEPTQVSVGSGIGKVTDIAAGLRHAAVLTDSQEIFTWGHGKKGQLGHHSTDDKLDLKSVPPGKVDIKTTDQLVGVVAGMYHTGSLTDKGDVYMWGCNKYGQCGQDPTDCATVTSPHLVQVSDTGGDVTSPHLVTSLSSGWTHILARTVGGNLYSWGRGDLGQLGRNCSARCDRIPGKLDMEHVVSQVCGSEHNLALTADGKIFSWGWNEHGICGTGDEVNVRLPHRISTFVNRTAVAIGCGAGHSFCLTKHQL